MILPNDIADKIEEISKPESKDKESLILSALVKASLTEFYINNEDISYLVGKSKNATTLIVKIDKTTLDKIKHKVLNGIPEILIIEISKRLMTDHLIDPLKKILTTDKLISKISVESDGSYSKCFIINLTYNFQ